jgi:4-carboxymuconolactone decarboxylase
MDKARFDKGLEVRTAVLGKDYVEASMKNADDFNRPFQELVTEYCWGAAWGSDGLPRYRFWHPQGRAADPAWKPPPAGLG